MRKVWTAPLGFAGNCRIVGKLDEIGLGKRREPSIATVTKRTQSGKQAAVVKRFLQRPGSGGNASADILDVIGDAEINNITQRIYAL